ncbi:family 16 glycosylhydrolase [Kineosporia sp. J2-2]|uniref:Family 16 glycosylhydrolase n=1 Tax=Kineosporia corallincola TaxID=2835133 RepID=A0ABS5TIL1_9ACTN|nr:family 16 glycosylhydrolase [Kineosporia corallincola]MBT0770708.1 family 16 glycosylhydrolase [Kineosporia corallincola]
MRPRRYLAAVAALVAAGVMIGSQAATAAPGLKAAKKKSSWELRSEVNFTGSSLPDGCVKYTGEYAAGSSAWSESNATLDDGVLELKIEKKKTDGQAYTTGGMGCWNWPQTYGKFEVKAKVPTGKGINSYITLSPTDDSSGNAITSLELLAPDQDTAYISNGSGKSSEQYFVEEDFADKKWHTYTIEWAPKHLLITLDKKEIYYSDKAYKGSRWLSMATTTGDDLSGKPDAGTKLPKYFQIDQMRIYKYTGVEPDPGETLSSEVDPAATPTPSASASGTTTASPTAAAAAGDSTSSGDGEQRTLIGGIWPWLIGGSVMIVSALAILSLPGRKKRPAPAPRGPRPPAGPPGPGEGPYRSR